MIKVKAKVYVLCGKIASGKTTYAESLRQSENAVVLSCDELMLSVFDECLGDKHDYFESKCVNYLCNLACDITNAGTSVILDYNFWSKKQRDDVKKFFTSKNITAELHYIKTEESKRLIWLEKRNEILRKEKALDNTRKYIISDELKNYLDSKFEEPNDTEIDKLIQIKNKK